MKPLSVARTLLVWSLAICGSWLLAVGLVLVIGVRGVLWVAAVTIGLWAMRWMWGKAFRQESEYVDEQDAAMIAFKNKFNREQLERLANRRKAL